MEKKSIHPGALCFANTNVHTNSGGSHAIYTAPRHNGIGVDGSNHYVANA
jgi:hypothetical protein